MRETLLFAPASGVGDDFARAEVAHGFLKYLLFLVQLEIHRVDLAFGFPGSVTAGWVNGYFPDVAPNGEVPRFLAAADALNSTATTFSPFSGAATAIE